MWIVTKKNAITPTIFFQTRPVNEVLNNLVLRIDLGKKKQQRIKRFLLGTK